eukprot:scaffold785_cov286-Prasinococcus_capsulatus_cf.AAC.4
MRVALRWRARLGWTGAAGRPRRPSAGEAPPMRREMLLVVVVLLLMLLKMHQQAAARPAARPANHPRDNLPRGRRRRRRAALSNHPPLVCGPSPPRSGEGREATPSLSSLLGPWQRAGRGGRGRPTHPPSHTQASKQASKQASEQASKPAPDDDANSHQGSRSRSSRPPPPARGRRSKGGHPPPWLAEDPASPPPRCAVPYLHVPALPSGPGPRAGKRGMRAVIRFINMYTSRPGVAWRGVACRPAEEGVEEDCANPPSLCA